ncbi:MAG: DUF4271 domain-containing protein [Prevotella sp.]|nr:DUF4271 domain-containing protein [Prevotella sp.]
MNDSLEVAAQTGIDQLNIANFVSGDSINMVSGIGVAGDPIPDTITNSAFFTLLLLVCFMVYVVSIARTFSNTGHRLRELFYTSREVDSMGDTSDEKVFQISIISVNCLMLAFFSYCWATQKLGLTFLIDNRPQFLLIAFCSFVVYYVFKWLLYSGVNFVFYKGKENLRWVMVQRFLWVLEGIITHPVILLLVYFDLAIEKVAFFFIFVLVLLKIITFYKVKSIFFVQKGLFLQSFLYFCALEIAPLVALVGFLEKIVETL